MTAGGPFGADRGSGFTDFSPYWLDSDNCRYSECHLLLVTLDRRGLSEIGAGIDLLRSENVGVFRNLFREGAIVPNDHDAIATVHQLSANLHVPGNLGRLVVDRTVTKDADVGEVKEVREAMRFGDGPLSFIRKSLMARCQGVQELSLEVGPGVSQRAQPVQMGGPISAPDAGQRMARLEIEKHVEDVATVELTCFELIVEAHQTLVARRQAIGLEVVALVVEMAAEECFPGHTSDDVGFLDETAEHAGASFGRLPKKNSPGWPHADAFRPQLGFLELEQLFATSLQGVLERGLEIEICLRLRTCEAYEEEILCSLDRELDALDAPGPGGIVGGSLTAGEHFARLEVDQESSLIRSCAIRD